MPKREDTQQPRVQFTIAGLLTATFFVAVMCALVGGLGALLICACVSVCVLLLWIGQRFGSFAAIALLFFFMLLAIVLVNVITVYVQHR